jgi:hypothetical protein
MTRVPQYWSLAVADIESFGRRSDTAQQALRTDLRTAIAAAFDAAGVDAAAVRTSDTGDGLIMRIPAAVPKPAVTRALTTGLNTQLVRRTLAPQPVEELRLRLALHAGEVGEDDFGITGTDLNTACRIVDAQVLRDVLATAVRAHLAVAASQTWYDAVIRHGYDQIDPAAYRPAHLAAKEVHQTVWLNVPSLSVPPGLPEYTPDPVRTDPQPPQGTAAAQPQPGARVLTVQGNQYGDSVMGDKHVGSEFHGKGGEK